MIKNITITETKPSKTEVNQPKPDVVAVVVPKAAPTGGVLVNPAEYLKTSVIPAPKIRGRINKPF